MLGCCICVCARVCERRERDSVCTCASMCMYRDRVLCKSCKDDSMMNMYCQLSSVCRPQKTFHMAE